MSDLVYLSGDFKAAILADLEGSFEPSLDLFSERMKSFFKAVAEARTKPYETLEERRQIFESLGDVEKEGGFGNSLFADRDYNIDLFGHLDGIGHEVASLNIRPQKPSGQPFSGDEFNEGRLALGKIAARIAAVNEFARQGLQLNF